MHRSMVLLLILITGCASMISTEYKEIPVNSYPDGAKVTVDNKDRGKTPTLVKLHRAERHVIKIEKKGYVPETVYTRRGFNGWVIPSIVLPPIYGIILDYASGAGYSIKPKKINVTLNRKQSQMTELEVYDPPGKDSIALMPTRSDAKGGLDIAVEDRLNHLFSESKRFSIVERDRIRDASTELNFQQTDLVDKENAVRMGKLLGASYILISSVSNIGDEGKQIFAKLISVETGGVVATAIAESAGSTVSIPALIQVVNKINSVK